MDYEFLIPGTGKAVIQNSKTNGSCVPLADLEKLFIRDIA
jgi:hypothetical protein